MKAGIADFLRTKRSKKDLKAALDVIREFKDCESVEEWAMISFVAWAKLEQLEEYLGHLVDGDPLDADTIRYIKRLARAKP